MEYICERDYDYILNKYHDVSKPYDIRWRFVRHDEIFDESTGLNGEVIKENIIKNDKVISHLPHPVRKAKAFEYVLDNTRISCDARDIFPAINMMDRPLNDTIIKEWRREVFSDIIPETEKRRAFIEKTGACAMWPDYDHSVPVWERLFSLGFKGILEDCEKRYAEFDVKKEMSDDEKAFFEGIKITYTAIINFIDRLYNLAKNTKGSEKMARALYNIKDNPPSTFYEALLVDYIYFMLSEHIEGLQVRSLSNFDVLFYPYYKNDLENGLTEEDIRKDLAYFLMQFASIDNYLGQPVFLGGCKADESTQINKLSYIFLDVYDKMNIYTPKVQLKIAESTPKDFILKALDMIRRGNNSIVLVCDDTIRKALEKVGCTKDEARTCDVKGCYEYAIKGSMGTGMNYLNLLKPLEYTMHEGCDGVTGEFMGLKSPSIGTYDTFEKFYDEYKRQLCYLIDEVIGIVNTYEDYLAYINPQSMLSATYVDCLEKGKDALEGGAIRNGSVLEPGYIADIADSLTCIKKYVYDDGLISLAELRNMLDNNFEGNEKFRLKLYNDPDKYGNNKELPDKFATELTSFIASYVCGRPNAKKRDGDWNCCFHVARRSYDDGKKTLATPNGRRFREELSKNCSSAMGQNKEGATAAILSVTKIDATAFTGDAALDLGLLPSAVKGEDGLEAMYGLLNTFMKRGGHAIHINVFDADTLRDAQKHPEKYQDLQIRVCGWNVLWNNINKEEQDGFIRQAESLV